MRLLCSLFGIASTLAACAHAPSPGGDAPAPVATPEPVPVLVSEADHRLSCNARLVTLASREGAGVRVDALVENRTNEPLVLSLPDRCPAGPAAFDGLADYDFYGTCAMGACPGSSTPRTIVVPERGFASIATVTLAIEGSACQRPLDAGPVELSFTVPGADGLRACEVTSARFDVPTRPASPTPAPPTIETPPRRRDCPAIACGGCSGGYAPSRDGCPSCECLEGPGVAPAPPSRGPSRP